MHSCQPLKSQDRDKTAERVGFLYKKWALLKKIMLHSGNNVEFEASVEIFLTQHHDQTKSTQIIFAQHCVKCSPGDGRNGEPFLEENKDLLRTDTRDIVDTAVASSICQLKREFRTLLLKYCYNDQLLYQSQLQRQNCHYLVDPFLERSQKASLQVSSLKCDISFFSRLYIACQSQHGDLDDFFRHDNQARSPPSLSNFGKS